jgi:hypothetical protein
MTRAMMKRRTAKAVAVARAPTVFDARLVLILTVLIGLLTQAAWMHAT